MAIKTITINGLRGFSKEKTIEFSVPDKKTPGSGLTIMVGPNNSGKSTVIEAMHLLSTNAKVISKGARNINTKERIKIEVLEDNNRKIGLYTTDKGGSYVERKINGVIQTGNWDSRLNTFILSSKRNFNSTFNTSGYADRENYKGNVGGYEYRSENNYTNNFGERLIKVFNNKEMFEQYLVKVLNPIPKWKIETIDENTSYLEFEYKNISHSSNGAGDGYINIFNIIDALYDASEDNIILIDEPEISLHPDLQKRLFQLLVECSKDKQIIISTHSPYFADWNLFANQSKILRFRKEEDDINVYELSQKTKDGINKIINDVSNIHTLSLDTNDIFFLQDNVILTEGQDDVVCYPRIFEQYDYKPNASYFGWGAGGANNISIILEMLKDLGYQKVYTIVDNDKREFIENLSKTYESYGFYSILADDVHDKKIDKNIKEIVKKINECQIDENEKNKIIDFINTIYKDKKGLIKSRKDYKINEEYSEDIKNLIENMKKYFEKDNVIDETKEEEKNKEIQEKINKSINEEKARKLLNEWAKKNNFYEELNKKYKMLEFREGDGDEINFKKISKNKFYVIIEQFCGLSKEYRVEVIYHFIIDIKKNKVKLKKEQVIKNTLPINKFRKLFEKIFC